MDIGHDNDDDDDGDHELLSSSAAIRAALNKGIDPYAVAAVLAGGVGLAVAGYIATRLRPHSWR